MTTTATLHRYTREYVNLSDLLDALALTDEQREDIESHLSRWYTWGEAATTLASTDGVLDAIADALPESPEYARTATALLDGVNFVNLEG